MRNEQRQQEHQLIQLNKSQINTPYSLIYKLNSLKPNRRSKLQKMYLSCDNSLKTHQLRQHNLSQNQRVTSKKGFKLPELIHSDRRYIAEKTRSIEEIIKQMVPNLKKLKANPVNDDPFKIPHKINKNSELKEYNDSTEVYNTEVPTEKLPLSPVSPVNQAQPAQIQKIRLKPKNILIQKRKDQSVANETTAPLSPQRRKVKEVRKSLRLYQGRIQNSIIPEEYEPRSTQDRVGFQKFSQRLNDTYRSSDNYSPVRTTVDSWNYGHDGGTTGTLRASVGEEEANNQHLLLQIQEINRDARDHQYPMYNKIKPVKLEQIQNYKVKCKKVSPRVDSVTTARQRKLKRQHQLLASMLATQ